MKKSVLLAAALAAFTTLQAQTKGSVQTFPLGGFTLHVYNTNDVMGDASYIVEGKDSLVTLEEPLFRDNVAEFGALLSRLGKPVAQRIASYHLGGTEAAPYVMPQGMPAFTRGTVYGGMMQGFARQFGDAIAALPTGQASEAAFGAVQTWAGVPFRFDHGAATDFPAASLLIGGKVYYTHWAFTRSHANPLQFRSRDAVAAELAAAEQALASGAEVFIGGHGGAATADDVRFRIEYLRKVEQLLAANKTPEAFTAALTAAYPSLSGADALPAVAQALYQ